MIGASREGQSDEFAVGRVALVLSILPWRRLVHYGRCLGLAAKRENHHEQFILLRGVCENVCVTRVGKVLSMRGTQATVKILDSGDVVEVSLAVSGAKKNSLLEIFADCAIGILTKREAEWKRSIRAQLLKS